MKILVLGAFERELSAVTKIFSGLQDAKVSQYHYQSGRWNEHDVCLALTGVGTIRSTMVSTALCEHLKPDLMVFCGVAGGLKSSLQVGDLVLADKIFDADLHSLPQMLPGTPYEEALIDPHSQKTTTYEYELPKLIYDKLKLFSFERLTMGSIVTSNIFPAPKNLFTDIKDWGCSAIEMENAGVATVAESYEIPVITLRAISNLLDEQGNDSVPTTEEALTFCAENLASCLRALLDDKFGLLSTVCDYRNQSQSVDSKYFQKTGKFKPTMFHNEGTDVLPTLEQEIKDSLLL